MSEAGSRAGEQEAAEAEVERFHDQLGPFVVAAETTRVPMVFTNAKEPDNPIVFANDSFLELIGYERAEVLGQSFNFLMVRDGDQDALGRIEAQFKGEAEGPTEVEYRRKDGRTLWAALFVSPVRDADGQVVQHFASFIDLTRHRDAQAQSRMLIDELNHRVKNILMTVQSIVAQGLGGSSDVGAAREAIEPRLFALSRSHDLLTRESWTSAGLRDVVVGALEPFGVADGRAERFDIAGENLRLPPKAVLALSIALHELATNAVKYGAFSNDAGRVLVDWSVEPAGDGGRVVLHWRETGGPLVAPPTRRGFGSQVIERGLAYELEGDVSLDYRPEGLVCTIDMPLPEGPAVAELLSGRRVLVVEDEFLILLLIEDMLADLGCESVSAAPSLRKALALIEAQPFDVAMLDMNLGGDKSFPIADALAARGVPFLFATGYDGHDMKDGYRDRPLLTKPFKARELGKVLAGLLSHPAGSAPMRKS